MPSGSHGGSRGSHSSGGSRSGGGRSSGGGFRSGGHRPRGPRYFYFGRRRYYISSRRGNAMSVLGFLATVMIFVAIIGVFLTFAGSAEKEKIEVDRAYYLNMISYAESTAVPNTHIRTAAVTDCFKSNNNAKWYIIYELDIETPEGGKLEGYSYSVYTMEEATALKYDGSIEVAINSAIVTSITDSIPLDYKFKAPEDDGEYMNAKIISTIGPIMLVVGIPVAVLLIIIRIKLAFGDRQPEQAAAGNTGADKVPPQTEPIKDAYCTYCGARISSAERNCPKCGASTK